MTQWQPSPGADEEGHCIVCGLKLEPRSETLARHECPPGFTPRQTLLEELSIALKLARQLHEVEQAHMLEHHECSIEEWSELDPDDVCGRVAVARWVLEHFTERRKGR